MMDWPQIEAFTFETNCPEWPYAIGVRLIGDRYKHLKPGTIGLFNNEHEAAARLNEFGIIFRDAFFHECQERMAHHHGGTTFTVSFD